MAWRYCPFADRVGLGHSSTGDSENEQSYCFAPQLVQNVLPGARGTPQERHFPAAMATADVGAGMGVAGGYWRVGCAVGAYWVCDWSGGAVLIVGCVFIAGL